MMSSLSEEKLWRLKESVLEEKIDWLCGELGDPARYYPELRAKRVLTLDDTQKIQAQVTDRQKVLDFVTVVSKRRSAHGEHGFDVLVDALKKGHVHAHVARNLTRALTRKTAEEEGQSAPAPANERRVEDTLSHGSEEVGPQSQTPET